MKKVNNKSQYILSKHNKWNLEIYPNRFELSLFQVKNLYTDNKGDIHQEVIRYNPECREWEMYSSPFEGMFKKSYHKDVEYDIPPEQIPDLIEKINMLSELVK